MVRREKIEIGIDHASVFTYSSLKSLGKVLPASAPPNPLPWLLWRGRNKA